MIPRRDSDPPESYSSESPSKPSSSGVSGSSSSGTVDGKPNRSQSMSSVPKVYKRRASSKPPNDEARRKKARLQPFPPYKASPELPLTHGDGLPLRPLSELVIPPGPRVRGQPAEGSTQRTGDSVDSHSTRRGIVPANSATAECVPAYPLAAIVIPTGPNLQWKDAAHQPRGRSIGPSFFDLPPSTRSDTTRQKASPVNRGIPDLSLRHLKIPPGPGRRIPQLPAQVAGTPTDPCQMPGCPPADSKGESTLAVSGIPDCPVMALTIPDGPKSCHTAVDSGSRPSYIARPNDWTVARSTVQDLMVGRLPKNLSSHEVLSTVGERSNGTSQRSPMRIPLIFTLQISQETIRKNYGCCVMRGSAHLTVNASCCVYSHRVRHTS